MKTTLKFFMVWSKKENKIIGRLDARGEGVEKK